MGFRVWGSQGGHAGAPAAVLKTTCGLKKKQQTPCELHASHVLPRPSAAGCVPRAAAAALDRLSTAEHAKPEQRATNPGPKTDSKLQVPRNSFRARFPNDLLRGPLHVTQVLRRPVVGSQHLGGPCEGFASKALGFLSRDLGVARVSKKGRRALGFLRGAPGSLVPLQMAHAGVKFSDVCGRFSLVPPQGAPEAPLLPHSRGAPGEAAEGTRGCAPKSGGCGTSELPKKRESDAQRA